MSNVFKGKVGEEIATKYLLDKGYEILERNYRFGKLELDIIAVRDNILVFVEVKARKSARYGYPESSVTKAKFQNMVLAAENYRHTVAWRGPFRFDIILRNKDYNTINKKSPR